VLKAPSGRSPGGAGAEAATMDQPPFDIDFKTAEELLEEDAKATDSSGEDDSDDDESNGNIQDGKVSSFYGGKEEPSQM